MIIRYKTKRDVNGNRYYLTVDTDKKTYIKDYNLWGKDTDIEITKKQRREIIEQLENDKFKEI